MATDFQNPGGRHHPADAIHGTIQVLVDAAELANRAPAEADLSGNEFGMGRELFAPFRAATGSADHGASVFFH